MTLTLCILFILYYENNNNYSSYYYYRILILLFIFYNNYYYYFMQSLRLYLQQGLIASKTTQKPTEIIMDTGLPDLSHLTEEERRQIESVYQRQIQEDEKTRMIVQQKQEEIKDLEESFKRMSEQQKKSGIELESTCHICMKTKFANGFGHLCHYCNIRCCARCSGKLNLRNKKSTDSRSTLGKNVEGTSMDSRNTEGRGNELQSTDERKNTLWVCMLCRKKQEYLSKTGQWINHRMTSNETQREGTTTGTDNRFKLQRTQSNAEKENHPFDSGLLRRQYSHQESSRMSSSGRTEEYREINNSGISYPVNERKPRISGYKSDSYTSDKNLDYLERTSSRSGSTDMIYPTPRRLRRNSYRNEQLRREILAHRGLIHQSSSDDEYNKGFSRQPSEEHDTESLRGNTDDFRHKEAILNEKIRNFLANPLTWKPSKDGRYVIGHMILKKSGWDDPDGSSAAMLGMKIVGGKLLDGGRRGAIIERVKKGSIADLEGHLKPGDEVIEWNGRSLQEKSYQDAHDIIAESKQEPQVELIVARPLHYRKSISHSRDSHDGRSRPSVTITSPGSSDLLEARSKVVRATHQSPSVGGRVQVKLWFDSKSLSLVVTLVCAVGLSPRLSGEPRNPYAKLYLLPDRSEKSKRRTKSLGSTNEPKWNQSFVYTSVRRSDLKVKVIEISVWDYERSSINDFLGEAKIELAIAPLNDDAEWFHLGPHEELVRPHSTRREEQYIPPNYFSPPSTSSRHSDSDISDIDDNHRRVADGASISSVGSSASPPEYENVIDKRKSRRDYDSHSDYKHMSSRLGPLDKHQSLERDIYAKNIVSRCPSRSRSVVTENRFRSRSKSPTRSAYDVPEYPSTNRAHSYGSVYTGYPPRGQMRPATSTPLSSPRRKQLPALPPGVSHALKERISKDLEVRGFFLKNRSRQPKRGAGRYTGRLGRPYCDNDLPHQHRSLSPQSTRDLGIFGVPRKDGDLDDSYSVDSSTFSTQSEQPHTTNFDDFSLHQGLTVDSPSSPYSKLVHGFGLMERSLSHSDVSEAKNIEKKSVNPLLAGKDSASSCIESMLDDSHGSTELVQHKSSPNTSDKGSVKSIPNTSDSPDTSRKLPKKSNSTSQLSAKDNRSGKNRKKQSLPAIVRSSEIYSGLEEYDSESEQYLSAALLKSSERDQYGEFVGELGPGQFVGRQALGTSTVGEIELGLKLQGAKLTVEIIRARNLQTKPGGKIPTPNVKLYLVSGKKCLEKTKVKSPRATLEPSYLANYTFKENATHCVLQVAVWGEHGRFERKKDYMGVAQIALSDLDQGSTSGWYKLFPSAALVL